MDGYTELFSSFLKTGLWNTRQNYRLSKDEFNRLWKYASGQACRGLVGQAMVMSKSVPPPVASKIQDSLLLVAGMNLKLGKVLEDSLALLRANGIDPVLLKGHGVASYYIDPMLRESGDIDFYVGEENYKAAFDILSAVKGCAGGIEFEPMRKHSHVEIYGITVEIHRFSEVLPRKYNSFYQMISRECLSKDHDIVRIGDSDVLTPEPTYNAFFLFNHLWRHFVTEGVGFRQLCDWTMFLHSNSKRLDLERLKAYLTALDLMRPWQIFGRIAIEYLDLGEDEMPFNDSAMGKPVYKVVDMMMSEGNFGHEREDWWTVPRESFLDKVHVFFMIARRYFKLIPIFGRVVFFEYIDRMRKKFLPL